MKTGWRARSILHAALAASLLGCAAVRTWAQADSSADAADPPGTVDPAPGESNPVPSLEGFTMREDRSQRIDTDPSQPGEETSMDAFEGPDGTAVGRLSTGGVVWGYGITPGGRVEESYFILDADCSGRFVERLPPTARFGPPPCVREAGGAPADGATPAPIGNERTGEAPAESFGISRYAPSDTSAAIVEVGLSSQVTAELPASSDGRLAIDPARVGTEFGDDTRHVLAWIRWEGAPAGTAVGLNWFFECQAITQSTKVLSGAAGTDVGVLQQEGSPRLPPGGYRLEILENGERVATIPFRIGGATPANPAHGSPECVAGS